MSNRQYWYWCIVCKSRLRILLLALVLNIRKMDINCTTNIQYQHHMDILKIPHIVPTNIGYWQCLWIGYGIGIGNGYDTQILVMLLVMVLLIEQLVVGDVYIGCDEYYVKCVAVNGCKWYISNHDAIIK